MISLKKLRNDTEICKKSILSKENDIDIDHILELDKRLRELKTISNEMRAKRNSASESIGELKKAGKDATDSIKKTRELGDELKKLEYDLNYISKTLESHLYRIPNIPHESVPRGKDETGNQQVRIWGSEPRFDFEPKSHLELGDQLGLFDFKRGAKLSGSGFPLYTGMGARLERQLINSMVQYHEQEFGFKEIFPPVLMKKESMLTTGQLPKFEEDMYHTEVDNLYLAPTAEVPVTNIHRDEIINDEDLPVCYVAYSPCFRRESGSYGKDTRGLLRVHQFNKVELVKFTRPETSYTELESLTNQAESILQKLGLHYRVVELCTGDLSFAAAKCYDLEIWAPGERKWLEVSSCSNFESFQARRGNIRYRNSSNNDVNFLHTLNGSGLATPRLFAALIETYQTETGEIIFPDEVAKFLDIQEIR
ncbi:MAG: serine--tRNA ligase [Euryarchaeota archaeon]|nr:serine--tRNA ligase [Euryarchaeota archaeon]